MDHLSKPILIFCSALAIHFQACKNPQPEVTKESGNPQELYQYAESEPRWSSFENLNGTKGQGGKENMGAKGHAYHNVIKPGDTLTLLDVHTSGVIHRMWFTLQNRSPNALRGLLLNMYWDNDTTPAVSVPFGDFFGVGLGKTQSFENSLFSNPEGRSFNSYIKMPFKTAAKIQLINPLDYPIYMLFFDIDFEQKAWNDNNLYFHAYWHRDTTTTLGADFELLPKVKGKGRFLGTNVSIMSNRNYEKAWWGEGEVKMYLDGDTEWPTLVGTGTEDYIGTAWGQGAYIGQFQGCTVADTINEQWSFYRYHIPDPIFFKEEIKVTWQQMGGHPVENIRKLQNENVNLIPIAIIGAESKQTNLFESGKVVDLDDSSLPREGWCNFYRSDDVAAVSYFYLETPSNGLKKIQDVQIRTHNLN